MKSPEGRRTPALRSLDRVMGYHRPVQSFNTGKKGEFNERVCFTEQSAKHHKFERK